mmetsp:Transcript_19952/g.28677  ORF Transcript_19952/g.28677 Transcript_19952/m.28677 type:complete len:101 (+) Transcript_19952:123-425(+)
MAQETAAVGRLQIVYSEMNENDQNFVIEVASNALRVQEKGEQARYHKNIAQIVKQELDTQKGGTWNVIVGKSFGSFVTHETKTISYFFLGNVAFLTWRHG